jgi:hypothetical protein
MKNEKKLSLKIGPWGVVALTIAYIAIMNLYFEYCISREFDPILQMVSTLIAIYYTWWQIKLIVNTIINYITNKIKKEE